VGGPANEPDEAAPSGVGAPFSRTNLWSTALEGVRAHDGEGEIGFARLVEGGQVEGPVNFVDLAVLPPGTSIGRHRHGDDEEEYYLVLDGVGTMWRDGDTFAVSAGDLVRNRAGGMHGLTNSGPSDLRLFVFEVGLPS
jgi:mannose-6-phosphate isomerase-like protein (cupin superfamily)